MKKLLNALLLASVALISLPVVYASTSGADYTAGTAVEYTAANTEAYTITVPARLTPGQSGTVTLEGQWSSDSTIQVTADESVDLINNLNSSDKTNLEIEFLGITAPGSNTERQTFTETVKVNPISNAVFGVWSGHFNYYVESTKAEARAPYQLYYNQPYKIAITEGNESASIEFIFYENGAVGTLVQSPEGILAATASFPNSHTQDQEIIHAEEIALLDGYWGDATFTISEDGKSINVLELDGPITPFTLSLEETPINDVQYGVPYDADTEGMFLIYQADGTIELYTNRVVEIAIPPSNIERDGHYIMLTIGSQIEPISIYPDGSKILCSGRLLTLSCSHQNTTTISTTPTCTQDGYVNGKICDDCHAVIDADEILPATGHSPGEGIVTTLPTCTQNGVTTYTCNTCHTSYTEPIEANGHQYENDSYICTVCGYENVYHYSLTASDYKSKTGLDISSGDIVIPEVFKATNGRWYKVTSIGSNAFENCTALTNVTLPGTVTSIGYAAFSSCENLASINIPTSVYSIGTSAFYNCSSLTNLHIPRKTTSFGSGAFRGCSSLSTLTYEGTLEDWLKLQFPSNDANPAWYRANLYVNTNELVDNITIPTNITTINKFAFMGCSSLVSVVAHDNVTSIGEEAFYSCENLETIVFGENSKLKTIGRKAFAHAYSLDMDIPSSVTTIGIRAFECCESLSNVVLPEGLTVLESGTFTSCLSLTIVVIPDNVTTTTYYNNSGGAFEGCTNLTTVTFGENSKLTNIAQNTFKDCKKLANINLPASLTEIGTQAFYNCSRINVINIPDGVTSIGTKAFYNCSFLNTVNIPAGVTSIKEETFYGCSHLVNITIPAQVTSIAAKAFPAGGMLTTVTFETPDGWWYANSASAESGTTITEDLSNPTTAARCLQQDYNTVYWFLGENN